MKYSNSKDKVSKISKYALNYAKMSGLFPDFKKDSKKKGGKTSRDS
jgi:hypothetical protein